jgi:hypothetical protein
MTVVCHIADCEQFFADRMKRTVAMERPLLLGADGFRYSEPLDAWQRPAVHSETGLVTLRQLLLHAIKGSCDFRAV